ncbi:MAG TPA: type 2 isopentenyl-diphosphate Delta-isomerase [Candidatus Aquilonibacter sp.]
MQRDIDRGSVGTTSSRKADHLRINIEQDVRAKGVDAGFDRYRFEHCAAPELALADVDLSTSRFGRKIKAPVLISCMTGGTPEARRINRGLATVAQTFGFAMGLGSARVLLERPETIESFSVRSVAPDVLLLANLGAVQLNKGFEWAQCRRLVDLLEADALVLHLNPLQEALQPEGDTDFRGLLARIETVCASIGVPVLVKEVGWGLDDRTIRALFDAGVAGVDVAGAGGTSWSEVERHRMTQAWRARVAACFASWGIPTTDCIRAARTLAPQGLVIGSGGVRDGMDAAKAIALGADLAGFAGPFLRAIDIGIDEACGFAQEVVETLRIVMFTLGARTVRDLQQTDRLIAS